MTDVPTGLLRNVPWLTPGSRSLRTHLLVWLLLPQLVLWAAAAVITYNVAARYANLAIDRSLYQASQALGRQVKPLGNGLLVDFPRAARDIIESDPDDKVYYMVSSPPGEFILGNRKLPQPPAATSAAPPYDRPVFYNATVEQDGKPVAVRIAALYVGWGEDDLPQTMLVQIAKSRASRDALAGQILIDMALPLSGLVLLMSVIVWAGIRAGLAPLARLRDAVVDRAPDNLTPIQLTTAPEEVRVLVSALNELLHAVRHSVAGQRRFISDAAHQLRTPLAGLKSQTELALKETADPELKQRLQRVHDSATRSAHLVSQLLTLARAEPESTNSIGRSRFDLRRAIEDVTAEMVPRALAAGIDLGMADSGPTPPPPVPVDANPLLIREAVANVIDNAIRYAGRGADVTVRVVAQDQRAIVEVEDSGPGILPEHHQAVFERFFRATHEGSGCGLGLAIVKEIVERHDGRVELHTRAPRGLRVHIQLRLAS
ncbi:sensor histidine kinase [Rhizobacter sp. Root1221]|uniref:sensor histidine kinase n=1 Tax=Rhizobacter sp. Root1221 TaxID=1736433 RepID=UPI0006F69A79|nr:sensor histidine kinase [Rhizobacter sp. Root1221]KQW00237.1 histidine kinase [Rhizobacter sp. Root1221]